MFRIKNVVKHYVRGSDTVKAVDDVSFEIRPGEILAFLGLNGAGKTTAIKIIAGLVEADSGSVETSQGQRAGILDVSALLDGHRNLYSRMTARENLEYFGVLRGLSIKKAKSRAEELLMFFGLTDKADVFAQKLSRGMQQRLAVSVAMMQEPKLLLLDEPTLGIDYDNTQLLIASLQKLKAQGVAILFTTHELSIAENLADRVAIIREGRIVADDIQPRALKHDAVHQYQLVLEDTACPQLQSLAQRLELPVVDNCFSAIDQRVLPELLAVINPANIVSLTKQQPSFEQVFLKHARSSTC